MPVRKPIIWFLFLATAIIAFTAALPLWAQDGAPGSTDDILNAVFAKINHVVGTNGVFFNVLFFTDNLTLPFVVLWLVVFGVYFTVRLGFVNFRLFRHAFKVVAGKYDDPKNPGEVSHFKALTSALSATVGLGNIAGVAFAIDRGGPGAVFWLWSTAFFGMTLKYSECTLAQKYRKVDEKGHVLGGPMLYLRDGFAKFNRARLGKFLAAVFALLCIGASFGGGNMFQANQTFVILKGEFSLFESPWIVGFALAFFIAIVIIGGIRRIGEVTSLMVPGMCAFYSIVCLVIIFANVTQVPAMFASIFREALTPKAGWGALVGVIIQGVQRASFSNEAGMGSAAIAHSAARTDKPVHEGVVGLIEPFIDTHVVCTMSSLAILITGAHLQHLQGIEITAYAFGTLGPVFSQLLAVAACVFAYSTAISWSYYGERATEYLFGYGLPTRIYQILFVLFAFIAPAVSIVEVLNFSDTMLLAMAIPNGIGMLALSRELREMTADYVKRLRSGEMKEYVKVAGA